MAKSSNAVTKTVWGTFQLPAAPPVNVRVSGGATIGGAGGPGRAALLTHSCDPGVMVTVTLPVGWEFKTTVYVSLTPAPAIAPSVTRVEPPDCRMMTPGGPTKPE